MVPKSGKHYDVYKETHVHRATSVSQKFIDEAVLETTRSWRKKVGTVEEIRSRYGTGVRSRNDVV